MGRIAGKASPGTGFTACYGSTAMIITREGYGQDGADCDPKPGGTFYTDLGWDFAAVWRMGADGYPHLQWEWSRTELTGDSSHGL